MAKQQSVQEEEQVSESYISVGLGLLVVIVVGILLYNYFTNRGTTQQDADKTDNGITEEATMSAKPGTTYTVSAGDTLWSIAEKAYQSGYNWVDIAAANNLTSSDRLEPGQTLVLPEATPKTATTEVAMTASLLPAPAATPKTAEASAQPTAQPTVQPTIQPTPAVSPVASLMATPVTSPVAIPTATVAPSTTTTLPSITGTSYTVVQGDTLWDIACRAYGDCYAWTRIAQNNKLVQPDLIHPGNILTLPR